MENVRCELEMSDKSNFVEKFDMSPGWQDKVRLWVGRIKSDYENEFFGCKELRMYLSNDNGFIYSSEPNRIIKIK